MSETNKTLVRRFVDAGVNKGDLDLMASYVTADYAYHGPGGQEHRGPDGLREFMTPFLTAFPGMQVTIDDQLAVGDKVVTRFTVRGSHTGPLAEIAATGKPIQVAAINIVRVEGEKIAEEWESFDELGMLQQIGAIPALE